MHSLAVNDSRRISFCMTYAENLLNLSFEKVLPFALISPDNLTLLEFYIFPESTFNRDVLPPPLAPRIAVAVPHLKTPERFLRISL